MKIRLLLVLLPLCAACGQDTGVRDAGVGDAGVDLADDLSGQLDEGSADDAATPADAATSADASADPISAPADTWTWVDFPESKCASGTPTGIAVNPHAGASDVLIYLEGGGECATAQGCWGTDPSAANLAGYGAAQFQGSVQVNYPALDRGQAGNPFAALNMVYVPYCTGDLHSGTASTSLKLNGVDIPTYFWGARDLEIFLARVVPTFPNAQRVYLLGTSAGGFGTYLIFDKVANAFGVRVDIINDSGPPLVAMNATQNPSLAAWGFVPPAGCASPCNTYASVLASARALQPSSSFAFLSYEQDTTISQYYGYTIDEYPAVLDAFVATLSTADHEAAFIVTNKQSHVVESAPILATQYLPWFTQLVQDDPSWANVTYMYP